MISDFSSIVSLDIETTGLSPRDDRILSLGMHSDNSSDEFFFNIGRKYDKKTKPSELLGRIQNSFIKSQLEKGRFGDLDKAWEEKRLHRPSSVGKIIEDNLGDKSAILIQNSQFENRFISSRMKNRDRTSNSMRYRTSGAGSLSFYTPPQVTTLKSDLRELKALGADFDEIHSTHMKIVSEYNKQISEKTGVVVVDLMDISSAFFSNAANAGILNKKTYDHTLNVDDLSRIFLNEEETHTALSDSRQQLQLLKKFSELNTKIDNGTLSEDEVSQLRRLDEINKTKINRDISDLYKTGMREIAETGQTKLIDPMTQTYGYIDVEENNGKVHKAKVPSYKNTQTAKTEEELTDFLQYRFGATKEEVEKIKGSSAKIPVKSGASIPMTKLEKGIIGVTMGVVAMSFIATGGGSDDNRTQREKKADEVEDMRVLYDSKTFKNIRQKNEGHKRM